MAKLCQVEVGLSHALFPRSGDEYRSRYFVSVHDLTYLTSNEWRSFGICHGHGPWQVWDLGKEPRDPQGAGQCETVRDVSGFHTGYGFVMICLDLLSTTWSFCKLWESWRFLFMFGFTSSWYCLLFLPTLRMAASSICRAGRPEPRWDPVFWRGLGLQLTGFRRHYLPPCGPRCEDRAPEGSAGVGLRWSQFKKSKSFQVMSQGDFCTTKRYLDVCDALFNRRWGEERPFAESISHRGGFAGIDEERCFSEPRAEI